MRRTLALLLLSAACAGDPPPPPPSTASAVLAPRPELLAAGTGALTPLAMALAHEVWSGTGLRVRVEPSIGSGGGIAATRDGAIDLGLVSRPLRPEEAAGLERVDLARGRRGPRRRARLPARRPLLRRGPPPLPGRAPRAHPAPPRRGRVRQRRPRGHPPRPRRRAPQPPLPAAASACWTTTTRWRSPSPPPPGPSACSPSPRSGLPSARCASTASLPRTTRSRRGTWRAVRTLGVVFRPERRDRVAPFLALASSERGRALIRSLGYLPVEPRR